MSLVEQERVGKSQPRAIRISHIAPWRSASKGGIYAVATSLVELLAHLSPEALQTRIDCGTSRGFRERSLPRRLLRTFKATLAIPFLVRRSAVVHVHVSETSIVRDILQAVLASFFAQHVLVHLHVYRTPDDPRPPLRRKVLRAAERFVDRMVFLAPSTSLAYRRWFGEKATYLSNAARDPGRVDVRSKAKEIIYLGRMSEAKGVHLLLEAFARLRTNGWSLFFYGAFAPSEIGFEKKFRMAIEKCPHAHWKGHVQGAAKAQALARAAVMVLPSFTEVFPVSLVEGAAYSCALIATDVGCTSDIVVPSVSGILVKPQSSKAIEVALEGMLLNQVQREQAAHGARRLFEERHSEAAVGKALSKLYTDIGISLIKMPSQ